MDLNLLHSKERWRENKAQVSGTHLVDLLVVGNELEMMHQKGQRGPMNGGQLKDDVLDGRHQLIFHLGPLQVTLGVDERLAHRYEG